MNEVKVVTGLRGAEHLLYRGYSYTKRRAGGSKVVQWRCKSYTKFKCNGELRTGPYPYDNPTQYHDHTHPPNAANGEVIEMRKAIRDEASSSQASPVNILASALVKLSDEGKKEVGLLGTIKRDIRNKRTLTHPPVPSKIEDFEIPEDWKTTGGPSPRKFLIFDSGSGTSNRICVFSTEESLRHLSKSTMWFMDGTFKTAPSLFQQIYVIRGEHNGLISTCIYALMTRKTTESYRILLSNILVKVAELGLFPKPEIIMTDFEAAAMAAVRLVFESKVSIKGCYFHLCQSTWRHIQEHGLVTDYKKNDDVKLFCGMLDALAFLPLGDVEKGMSYLWGSAPTALFELLNYFDTTYVSGINSQPPVAPLFPPHVWNVHESTLSNLHRTNNLCESWNHRFSKLVGHSNPSVWNVISAMRKDVALERTRVLTSTPEVTKHKKSLQIHQQRLQSICQEYVSGDRDLPNFLRAVGSTIRYK